MKIIKKIFNKLGVYRTYRVKVSDVTFNVPIYNRLGFANLNLKEPWMQELLKKIGSEKSTFLDVGVNVGQTLMRWKAEYPKSKYIGIEPNTDCVSYVNKLITENNISNSVVLPVALGEAIELNYLYISKTDPSDSAASTIENFRKNEDRKAIPIITMPFNLLKESQFDIIKIDVEGAELEIIKSIFEQNKIESVFVCEILPVYNSENSVRISRQKEIEHILASNEYSIFRIEKQNKVRLKLISEFGIHSDLEACDYLFIPNSKVNSIIVKF